MLHIKSLEDGLEVFKSLGSEIRIEIIKLLLENRELNMNDLAARLKITNGALTSHVRKLEDSGLIRVRTECGGHGNQKIYSVAFDKILVDITPPEAAANLYEADLKVGHYSNYSVSPTCGLSSSASLIGEVDDPRYFAHPNRYEADILWFSKGYVEYTLPNLIPSSQKIDQIAISVELSSEAPGVNDEWPSDIHFYLNDICIGTWTSPGDFGSKGFFTPDWWYPNWNQHGLLKLLVMNQNGTFIDGLQISNVSLDTFHFDSKSLIKFKLGIPDDASHIGGLTIFGKTFGNYSQDIHLQIHYSPIESTFCCSQSK